MSENLAFQNLLKNRTLLLLAEKFGNVLAFDKESRRKFNHLYPLTVLCLNRKFFDFKRTPFKYYVFSVAMNLLLWGCG